MQLSAPKRPQTDGIASRRRCLFHPVDNKKQLEKQQLHLNDRHTMQFRQLGFSVAAPADGAVVAEDSMSRMALGKQISRAAAQ